MSVLVFVSGFILLSLEIIGLRILAPYLGSSIIVWSGTIGVILAAMSLGYQWGGRRARREFNANLLAHLFWPAALFMIVTAVVKDFTLPYAAKLGVSVGAVAAPLLFYFVPSFCLAAISPLAVQLVSKRNVQPGEAAGNLSAISAIGSVTGVFSTGYLILPYFSNKTLLVCGAVILLLCAAWLMRSSARFTMLALCAGGIGAAFLPTGGNALAEGETYYNHYRVYERKNKDGLPIRALVLGTQIHSTVFLDNEKVFQNYLKIFELDTRVVPEIKSALMLGGGAMSFPRSFVRRLPEARITVVEIDPQLPALARRFFNFKDDPRINVVNLDARVFLNQTTSVYDVIYCDAFLNAQSVPFQLTTREAVAEIKRHLNGHGAYFLNMVSSLQSGRSQFLKAEVNALHSAFRNVAMIREPEGNGQRENFVLIASDSAIPLEQLGHGAAEIQSYPDGVTLTDDFAPVDYFTSLLL